ncbi:MAG: lysophospholipid acyltransferase family protein [Prevotellaceae bacterium]|jgi:putative hemolysin|nr:lysophospholipid acyltransferase family protein [Prevotellaceae bacterium]
MKKSLIDIHDLEEKVPFFRGKFGNRLGNALLKMVALDKANHTYANSIEYRGSEFTEHLLSDLGVSYRVGNAERLDNLPEGAFITISNHPYGGLDGIMLIDLIARRRPDFKVLVNEILSLIRSMDDNFISTQPHTGNSGTDISKGVRGIRESIKHIANGHPLGLFPAGAVSNFEWRNMQLLDREWQESVIRLIRMAKVPVLPIRFFDGNSALFYALGLIDWRIRTLKMPSEIFNKQHQYPRIGIGKLISPDEIASFTDAKSLSNFLRKSVYDMPLPKNFSSMPR